MGHSQSAKAESHKRIVKIASRKLREAGPDALSVAQLMKAAGMTHGGFYAHFASRDALVGEALTRALEVGAGDAARGDQRTPAPVLREGGARDWVRSYLSRAHRDGRPTGCALAALAGDIARAPKRQRAIFTPFLLAFARALGQVGAPDNAPDNVFGNASRNASGNASGARQGLAAASTMIGALILARAVDDEALSDDILMAARQAVLAQLNV